MQVPASLPPYHGFGLDEQAVDALSLVAEFLGRIEDDPSKWKWVVIALYDALHGYMGLALRRTDGLQLLTGSHERRKFQALQRGDLMMAYEPDYRVDQFLNLFEKVQDPARMETQFVHSQVFRPAADQDRSVRYLDQLRNDLAHYSDTTLVVAVFQLPQMVTDCVAVIDFLVNESQNVTVFPELHERTNELLHMIAVQASHLGKGYAQPVPTQFGASTPEAAARGE